MIRPDLRVGYLTFLVKAAVGIVAGRLSAWLRVRPGMLTWVFRSSGANLT